MGRDSTKSVVNPFPTQCGHTHAPSGTVFSAGLRQYVCQPVPHPSQSSIHSSPSGMRQTSHEKWAGGRAKRGSTISSVMGKWQGAQCETWARKVVPQRPSKTNTPLGRASTTRKIVGWTLGTSAVRAVVLR